MPESANDISRNEKLKRRLRFYEDLGLAPFYRSRTLSSAKSVQSQPPLTSAVSHHQLEESSLPKSSPKPASAVPIGAPARSFAPLSTSAPSLFDGKLSSETLVQIRHDLGECTRCKLHSTRHTIVFGDGNPQAQLVFVGEGPGADEDAQGLPFVGRAGKLLTQMIEAMGLERRD